MQVRLHSDAAEPKLPRLYLGNQPAPIYNGEVVEVVEVGYRQLPGVAELGRKDWRMLIIPITLLPIIIWRSNDIQSSTAKVGTSPLLILQSQSYPIVSEN